MLMVCVCVSECVCIVHFAVYQCYNEKCWMCSNRNMASMSYDVRARVWNIQQPQNHNFCKDDGSSLSKFLIRFCTLLPPNRVIESNVLHWQERKKQTGCLAKFLSWSSCWNWALEKTQNRSSKWKKKSRDLERGSKRARERERDRARFICHQTSKWNIVACGQI